MEIRSSQVTSPLTKSFLDKGYTMLYLDQRGTGLSTPITASTLGLRGDDPVQATYMKSFRADNIVRDCEAIRQVLTQDYPEKKKQWSIIGQSFGGFCAITYLSLYPQGLREAFITGGLPPLSASPDDIYKRTFAKLIQRNKSYYAKFPEDVQRVKDILRLLKRFGDNTVRLPSEGALSARRFLQLGIAFGMHDGIDEVHNVVLRCANDLAMFGHLTRGTTAMIDAASSFETNIIYAILHEAIYLQGQYASKWSAERVMASLSEFDVDATLEADDKPVFFTGEMVFPFMLDSYSELRKVKEVANILATDEDWPKLYDEEQLAKNEVPVYAAVYNEDMYVDVGYSMETASKIKGCKTMLTNLMYHNALRSKMEDVVEGLWNLRCDTID
jgi:pimeloyl-ACP methyl ester carboxylesterase